MFPDKLKELRKGKKKTQQDMADYLGITRQGYAKYENGQAETDLETLRKLAEYFSVTTDYLVGKSDNPNQTRDDYLDEEIRKLSDKMQVWYKNEPKDKEVKLDMLRRMIKSFEEDE